ncbi:c-type cytochrome [Allosphingosinicella sp.]|uniref:c-type cytochrome n=1 Tax=Allosphingosinicella sp. TaxID=2823234 RepID=UPI002FC13213
MKCITALPALALALLALSACGSARRSVPVAGPMAIADPQVALGERVFMRECSVCHPRGEAGLAPGINNKPLPEFLIKFQVRNGLGAMLSFSEEHVSPEELDAIVEYLEHMRGRG